jgi:transcriptional regulator with XRE-family HTH domain
MLAYYRTSAGLTPEQLGAKVFLSGSQIRKVEAGTRTPSEDLAKACENLPELGCNGALTALYEVLSEHLKNRAYPGWFAGWPEKEAAARRLRSFELVVIPGLLQTEEYASAVISLGDFPVDQADRLVVLRKERQRRFRDDRLKLWIVLDESALRRPVAGRKAQLDQLAYLREVCQSPRLTLQVIPYGAGGHAAPTGFSILRFAERDLPDVVYVENLTSALYLDKQADVDRYLLAMERLSIVAHEPNETAGILDEIISQLESEGPDDE